MTLDTDGSAPAGHDLQGGLDETTSADTFLGRSFDHIGVIGTKLRDLSGFATLAYELLQNAEDAKASRIVFRIDEDALVVENDGVFSDCRDVDAADCPWLAGEGRGHRCDFHRFRLVAAGDKRAQVGTVGAFGIGFMAVYQITDTPNLMSAGRHWIIDETKPEDGRIRVCHGCQYCQAADLPGTQFRFPWARDPNSAMRRGTRADAIAATGLDELERELASALGIAMLFLRNLDTAELWRGEQRRERIERLSDVGTVVLQDLHGTRLWHVVEGEFADEAEELRAKHPGRIESKRTANVRIAIPSEEPVNGILWTFLPTQQSTHLPFHIQADFFPSSDRKRISFVPGFEGDWNSAAIVAAAHALTGALTAAKTQLGPSAFWQLLQSVQSAAADAGTGQLAAVFAAFWKAVQPSLKSMPCVWLASKMWALPAEALLLEREDELESERFLTGIGVPIVHSDLRPYFSLLRSAEIGVRLLDVPDVTRALKNKGVISPFDPHAKSWPLGEPAFPECIWEELRVLLSRKRREDDGLRVVKEVRAAAIVPCRDGLWRAASEVFWTDDGTARLFEALALNIAFAGRHRASLALGEHCRPFDAKAAVDALALRPPALLELPPGTAGTLLSWFDERKGELRHVETLRTRLAALPIFPSAKGLRPLTKLSLPGDFVDPLDLAELVDVDACGGLRELLSELGARKLTIQEYASRHVPAALANPEQPIEKRRAVVRLFAAKLGELRDDQEARKALGAALIVECEDEEFRKPSEVYLPSDTVRAVLGPGVRCSSASSHYPGALREFLLWLGVADEPRLDDVFVAIVRLAGEPRRAEAVASTSTILLYLARQHRGENLDESACVTLKSHAWLPAEGDETRGYKASEIQSVFRDFLFRSQGRFLGLSRPVQNEAANLLVALAVRSEPTPDEVVSHLLYCAARGVVANPEVFSFLAAAAGNEKSRAALRRLERKACIPLPDGAYYTPQHVFWGEQPFGRWRAALGADCRKYQPLFDLLSVREAPEPSDAIAVLWDIELEFGRGNSLIDADAQAVVLQCWRLLAAALDKGEIGVEKLQPLSDRKVVPGPQGHLEQPAWMFFEDRAGFNKRFPRLRNNLIAKPEGAWPALAAAGVMSIAEAAAVALLEATGAQRDELLEERLNKRLQELARVVEVVLKSGKSGPTLAELIGRLRCVSVDTLLIQFTVDVFGRDEVSDPEEAAACYDREAHTIYCRATEHSRPWPAIARELAQALGVDSEVVGTVASGFREVLAADTLEQAQLMLDELGFSRLAVPAMAVASVNTFECLAGADELPDREPFPASGEMRPDYENTQPGSTSAAAIPSGAGATDTAGGANAGLSKGSTGDQADGKRSDVTAQAKLRSYVARSERVPHLADSGHAERDARIAAIDQAGIAYVMRFEREAGRSPTEMPHANPGYDIESRDLTGRVVRYIEVKSSAVTWGAQGVALSDVQFQLASTMGEAYWLYVVDRALEESAHLHRIQDPARRVNQYFFDGGWRVVAE